MAEYLSVGLAKKMHEVYVYNSHDHQYNNDMWNGVHIVHCRNPEHKMGTAGQFIYDLNCILDARARKFDVILILGYTSSSVWGPLYPRKSIIITNMDGLEWKRTKYSAPVRKFLLYAERLAVKFNNYLVADSLAIQSYLSQKYGVRSEYIAYGAEVFTNEEERLLTEFDVSKYGYYMLMGRMEPENNIEMILAGFAACKSEKKFIVVGNTGNKYGQYLVKKFQKDLRIQFTGAVYDAQKIHSLKIFSELYFHGHSVGGTNPSLLEAMASQSLIAAHHNRFNRAILDQDAFYFSTDLEVKNLIEKVSRGNKEVTMIHNNLKKVKLSFSWNRIIEQYEDFILNCCKNTNHERNTFH